MNAETIEGNSSQWLAGTRARPDGTFALGPVLGENVIIQVDQCSSAVPIVSGVYAGPDEPLTRDYSRAGEAERRACAARSPTWSSARSSAPTSRAP